MRIRTSRRVRRAVAATLLAAPLGAAAIGAAAGAAGAAGAATAKLRPKLLAPADMPAGWKTVYSITGGGVGCLSRLLEPAGFKQAASATADYRYKTGSPELFEKLASFADPAAAYAKTVATIAACHTVNGDPGGNPTTGTVARMAFPHLGTSSEAFAVRLDVAGTTVNEDFVFVRSGSVLLGLDEAFIGPSNVAQVRSFAAKAAAKLG